MGVIPEAEVKMVERSYEDTKEQGGVWDRGCQQRSIYVFFETISRVI